MSEINFVQVTLSIITGGLAGLLFPVLKRYFTKEIDKELADHKNLMSFKGQKEFHNYSLFIQKKHEIYATLFGLLNKAIFSTANLSVKFDETDSDNRVIRLLNRIEMEETHIEKILRMKNDSFIDEVNEYLDQYIDKRVNDIYTEVQQYHFQNNIYLSNRVSELSTNTLDNIQAIIMFKEYPEIEDNKSVETFDNLEDLKEEMRKELSDMNSLS